jgi:predicted ATP-dependent endonuclease of OLD family
MELESVQIKRYRSIDECELTGCADFNVLIGKNNSGKSNIMSAIWLFFQAIRGGQVATVEAPVRDSVDFFENKTAQPMEITLTLGLSLAERDALIQDIVAEAPHVKAAVEGIDPKLQLIVTFSATSRATFVSRVSLRPAPTSGPTGGGADRVVLGVSVDAGVELRQNLLQARQKSGQAETLRRFTSQFDLDDWNRYRSAAEDARGRFQLPYMIRRYSEDTAPEITQIIDSAIRESSSYESSIKSLANIATTAESEAEALRGQKLKNTVSTFAGEEGAVPNYVRNLLRRIGDIPVLNLTERRKPIGKEEANRLLSLKVTRGGPEVLRQIQETISALLGVKVDAFQSSASRGTGQVAEMDVDNFLVELNGSGVREALRLILDVEFERPKILLVEEPEIHLHPALEISMMRYLKRVASGCQVFITTHSTNFLDQTDLRNVYMVSKDRSTQVRLLHSEEVHAQVPKALGTRMSSLFMYDRLLFVEGPSDEEILREWATLLGVNFGLSNTGFLHMGGARNFAYFAVESTLSFLSRRQVKMWFLLDRDERSDEDVEKLRRLAGESAQVNVLECREIENHLVSPRPIVEFIKLKRKLAGSADNGGSLTEANVLTIIERHVEALKNDVIERRVTAALCRPLVPPRQQQPGHVAIKERIASDLEALAQKLQDSRNRIDTVVEAETQEVNRLWQSKKFLLVPGSELLDSVCKEFGVRFNKKSGDGGRLASLMIEDEIDKTMKSIIRDIGGA